MKKFAFVAFVVSFAAAPVAQFYKEGPTPKKPLGQKEFCEITQSDGGVRKVYPGWVSKVTPEDGFANVVVVVFKDGSAVRVIGSPALTPGRMYSLVVEPVPYPQGFRLDDVKSWNMCWVTQKPPPKKKK
jgi:hypothetical protein